MASISSLLQTLTPPDFSGGVSKKKKTKVKIDSSEEGVANVLTGFLKNKEKELKTKLDTKTKEKTELEAKIKELVRKARTLETTTGALVQKYQDTVNKNRSEVVDDYRKLITKIKLLEFIEKFEVDNKKRILFTTTPISIQKKDWTEPKVAGRYQVRIDFAKGNIADGIQGINIDQHYDGYDHPNLSNGKFCYGQKLSADVEQEYREQDLYELVIDLVDLLRSPNDKDGWTRWGYFFKSAKKRPKNYSFEKFDQENTDGVPWEITGTTTFSSVYGQLADAMTTATATYAQSAYQSMTSLASPYYGQAVTSYQQRPSDRQEYLETIAAHLVRIGFIDTQAAQYFAERILHRTRDATPDSIELRRLGPATDSDAELYYRCRSMQRMATSLTEAPRSMDLVERIMVPGHMLRPENSQQVPSLDPLIRNEAEAQRAQSASEQAQVEAAAQAQLQQAEAELRTEQSRGNLIDNITIDEISP